MPVVKIFFDESLDDAVRNHRTAIQAGLERMMRDVLAADPAKCQVVMVASGHCTPKPVYVDMQYRAEDHRDRAVVAQAMQNVAAVLQGALGCGLRIRAFDIDQTALHALDLDAGEVS